MRWTKIQSVEEQEKVVYLPSDMAAQMAPQITIMYGTRKMTVSVRALNDDSCQSNQFNRPVTVFVTQSVVQELLIQVQAIYQMKNTETTLSIGPVIGLFLGEQHYYYNDRFMSEFTDAMGIYQLVGGLITAFKETSIDWGEQCIYGLYFDYTVTKWRYGKFPIPNVIFRRAFHTGKETISKLKEVTGGRVFNSLRMDKWETYEWLSNQPYLKDYLPTTRRLVSYAVIREFFDRYSCLILKPAGLSRGRGICIIEKQGNNHYFVFDLRKSKSKAPFLINEMELQRFLHLNMFYERNYILQPCIEFATIDGYPFDIRVVMQKGPHFQWKCSGIECRVAGSNAFITNISRGGDAMLLSQACQLSFGGGMNPEKVEEVEEELITLATHVCECMDQTGESYAEFGLDFAIDRDKRYWFIEANVRPTFHGFKILDKQKYYEICYTPILYAAAVAGFWKEG